MTQNQMRVLRVLGGSDGSRRNCTIYTFSWFKSLAVLFPINEEPKTMLKYRHLYRLERWSSHGGNLIHNKSVLGSILNIRRMQLLEEIEDA